MQRLSVEKRVAELLVTGQETLDGKTRTTLLLVEVGRNGVNLPPKGFVVEGKEVTSTRWRSSLISTLLRKATRFAATAWRRSPASSATAKPPRTHR